VTASAVVVGAGAFGVAAADALARRGWAVTIVERFAPANARGSSGDRTRLLRLSHGDDDDHGDWLLSSAARGIAGWRALAEEEGVELVEPTGLVVLATEPGGAEDRAADRLERAGVDHARLTPREVKSLIPELAVDDLAFALYEPGASVIRATDAVLALLARAERNGAQLRLGTARLDGPGCVRFEGERIGADVVVWACGAWLGTLFPSEAPVRAARQTVIHWHAPASFRGVPAWFDAELYGFPDLDGLGMKAVSHRPGASFDLERDARLPGHDEVDAVARAFARRFPALGRPTPLWARVMPYEMTPDGYFVIGPSAEHARHWILGGGSGHGFKHAPALGEHLADLLEGRGAAEPRLAPGPRAERFAVHGTALT
jgi:sarcosine oxidase